MKESKQKNTNFKVSRTDKVFALVKDENGKVNITLGGYAVSSKKFDTFEQADRYLITRPYELFINICAVIFTKHTQNEKENNKNATETK